MRISEQPPASTSLLLAIAGLVLLAIFGLLVRFSRIRLTAFWLLVLGWEVLFVWYAWFSPAAPFAFHEAHRLDAGVARDSTIHYAKSGALFGLLFVWFLSLPLARMTWKGRADAV